MSERKVLNKYYPPDYDPSKIPKLPKGAKSRQWVQRVMAPFNMRCNTCGEYIARAKKFNMRREKVVGEDYLGLMIFRFYLRCPRCVAEITFKTDLKNCDYEMEHGATRNFMAQTLIKREEAALKEEKAKEVLDPMTVLENRTKDSQKEMAMMDTLEELQEMTRKSSKISHDDVINMVRLPAEEVAKREQERQEAEDEAFVRSIFGGEGDVKVEGATQCEETPRIKRLQDSSSSSSTSGEEQEEEEKRVKRKKKMKTTTMAATEHQGEMSGRFTSSSSFSSPTTFAVPKAEAASSSAPSSSAPSSSSSAAASSAAKGKHPASWNRSVGSLGSLKKSSLVVKKKAVTGGIDGSNDGGASNGGSSAGIDIAKEERDQKNSTASGGSGDKVSGTENAGTISNGAGSAEVIGATPPAPSSGLLGLGAYSDSDESD